ncbi:MAG: EAL domain-containing protein [Moraxellaceae bacterium]|nr:MAG: EAL domain-containing protein [Moraxellaceae bacterium]
MIRKLQDRCCNSLRIVKLPLRWMTLVRVIPPCPEAIVRAILAMGHSLNMQVVAEGVETIAHADFLILEGCDVLQGYLISKPLNSVDATALLQNSPSLQQFLSPAVQ